MHRHELEGLVSRYRDRGESLHEVMRVEPQDVEAWLRGDRIPRDRVEQLKWWDGSLRVREALEASGLPECAEMQALDRAAASAILRKARSREQNRAAQAVLDHEASCDLCRQREAVRASAGPVEGEPFPGFRDMVGDGAELAKRTLWTLAACQCLVLGAFWADGGDASGDLRLFYLASVGLVVPVMAWSGVRARWSNGVAALCNVGLALVGLYLYGPSRVVSDPALHLPGAVALAAMAAVGIVAHWNRRQGGG